MVEAFKPEVLEDEGLPQLLFSIVLSKAPTTPSRCAVLSLSLRLLNHFVYQRPACVARLQGPQAQGSGESESQGSPSPFQVRSPLLGRPFQHEGAFTPKSVLRQSREHSGAAKQGLVVGALEATGQSDIEAEGDGVHEPFTALSASMSLSLSDAEDASSPVALGRKRSAPLRTPTSDANKHKRRSANSGE